MIRVIVVDDSAVLRRLLVHILESDPSIQVVATAEDGADAPALVAQYKPDVVTMDIQMKRMDGYEATRRIMQTHPVPVVIVTASYSSSDIHKTFKALKSGAVSVLNKPPGPESPEHEKRAKKLIQTVKAMSEVRVVTRTITNDLSPPVLKERFEIKQDSLEVVAIGASTGGPPVLQAILSLVPKDYPLPILVVQHISRGFLRGLVDWLKGTVPIDVCIAAPNEPLQPGRCYLAPDDFHMGVSTSKRVVLSSEAPEGGIRPSINHLFHSIAKVYGGNSLGVLLTGMGRDGADGLKAMKDRGAITIVQDEASSVVFGMPKEAIAIHATDHVFSPPMIARMLADISTSPSAKGDRSAATLMQGV